MSASRPSELNLRRWPLERRSTYARRILNYRVDCFRGAIRETEGSFRSLGRDGLRRAIQAAEELGREVGRVVGPRGIFPPPLVESSTQSKSKEDRGGLPEVGTDSTRAAPGPHKGKPDCDAGFRSGSHKR